MKKDLNFEINILPILDILSVLICFLLLTAVWTQIGTLDTHQALGDNRSKADKNPPSMWIAMSQDGSLQISLRDLKPELASHGWTKEASLVRSAEGINWQSLSERISLVKKQIPELKTVVITPSSQSNYGDVIKIMDYLKKNELTDIGLSPLG